MAAGVNDALQRRVAVLESQVATLQRLAMLESQVATLRDRSPPPSPPDPAEAERAGGRLHCIEEGDGVAAGSTTRCGAPGKSHRNRSLSARPTSLLSTFDRRRQCSAAVTGSAAAAAATEASSAAVVGALPLATRSRGVTDARAQARAETEAKIREHRQTLANHAEVLAKREVDAVNRSFEEDRRGRRCPVINPYSVGIRWWEVMITAVLCYQAFEMPLRLAFEEYLYSRVGLSACRWVELLIDTLFLVDLVLNFFLSYLDDDLQVVTDHTRIARRYLSSWFLVDLLGGVPVDAFFPAYWRALSASTQRDSDAALSGTVGLLKTVKLSRLFKMLKLVKLGFRIMRMLSRRARARAVLFASASSCLERLSDYLFGWITPFAWVVMKQLALFLFFVHVFACVQFTLSDAHGFFPDCAGRPADATRDADVRQCWLYRAHIVAPPPGLDSTTDANATAAALTGASTGSALGGSALDAHSGGELYAAAFFHTGLQVSPGGGAWRMRALPSAPLPPVPHPPPSRHTGVHCAPPAPANAMPHAPMANTSRWHSMRLPMALDAPPDGTRCASR